MKGHRCCFTHSHVMSSKIFPYVCIPISPSFTPTLCRAWVAFPSVGLVGCFPPQKMTVQSLEIAQPVPSVTLTPLRERKQMYCLSFLGVFVYISAARGVADHIRRLSRLSFSSKKYSAGTKVSRSIFSQKGPGPNAAGPTSPATSCTASGSTVTMWCATRFHFRRPPSAFQQCGWVAGRLGGWVPATKFMPERLFLGRGPN